MLSAGVAAFEGNIIGQHKGVCPEDRNVLLIRSVKSAFALLLAKVTKLPYPAENVFKLKNTL